MKIIICGAGQVGSTLAAYLAQENNDVTVIDKSSTVIDQLGERMDIRTIKGMASHPDVLENAGAREAEMIIAATDLDETNMLACQVAHTLFNVPKKIARIRDNAYLSTTWSNLFSRDHMPIDHIIMPEQEIAKSIINRLNVPGAYNIFPVADGLGHIIGAICHDDSALIGKPLETMMKNNPDLNIRFLIGIRKNEKFFLTDDFIPEDGDEIYFMVDAQSVSNAMTLFTAKIDKPKNIVIMGGGNVGFELAKKLEQYRPKVSVKLIELNKRRANYVSQHLNNTVVINGDALDPAILQEARINEAETFIAVTENDEANILASIIAKRQGGQRSITLAKRSTYPSLMSTLGIDAIVNPRAVTVSSVMHHVRRGPVRYDYTLRDGFVEIIEMEPDGTAQVINNTIEDLHLPKGIKIAGIRRKNDLIIPNNETEIHPNDRVILMVEQGMAKKVERLFAKRADYY